MEKEQVVQQGQQDKGIVCLCGIREIQLTLHKDLEGSKETLSDKIMTITTWVMLIYILLQFHCLQGS